MEGEHLLIEAEAAVAVPEGSAAEGEALHEKVPPHAHNVSRYQSLFGLDFLE
jgi:hypothetical protein